MNYNGLESAAAQYLQSQRYMELHPDSKNDQAARWSMRQKLTDLVQQLVGSTKARPDEDEEYADLEKSFAEAHENLLQAIVNNNGIHMLNGITLIHNGRQTRIKPELIVDFSTEFGPDKELFQTWDNFRFSGQFRARKLEIGAHDVLGFQTRQDDQVRILVPKNHQLNIPVRNIMATKFGVVELTPQDLRSGLLDPDTFAIKYRIEPASFACFPAT